MGAFDQRVSKQTASTSDSGVPVEVSGLRRISRPRTTAVKIGTAGSASRRIIESRCGRKINLPCATAEDYGRAGPSKAAAPTMKG